jgi:hypothetical protein
VLQGALQVASEGSQISKILAWCQCGRVHG